MSNTNEGKWRETLDKEHCKVKGTKGNIQIWNEFATADPGNLE